MEPSFRIKRKPVPVSVVSPEPAVLAQDQRQQADERKLDDSGRIFRPLEEYIFAIFDGCDALNNSFLTASSRHPRAASEGVPASRKEMEVVNTVLHKRPVLQLDGNPLRAPDVLENDASSPQGQPIRHRSTNEGRNMKSISTYNGRVSSKSPRINWPELSEWYRLIAYAGESWRDTWQRMKLMNPGELAKWEAIELSVLESIISESKTHLKMALFKATERLLQRPKRPLHRPEDIRFLLIILANPFLYQKSSSIRRPSTQLLPPSQNNERGPGAPLTTNKTQSPRKNDDVSSGRPGEHDRYFAIIKRIVGLLSSLPGECHRSLVSWFSKFSERQFRQLVELIGSFVTYRLRRNQKRRPSVSVKLEDNLEEYVPTFSGPNSTTPAQLHSALRRDTSSKSPKSDYKHVIYSEDWQIRAAARVMSLLFQANSAHNARRLERAVANSRLSLDIHERLHIIPINTFYNTFLDYADLITDFEAWESRNGKFTFCQYSFFLSIWAKIRILEHDARRQMEAKAREAFFETILGRQGTSQYLVLKIRRECLVEDSLRGVSEVVGSAQGDIKKGLRIEFLGEEGVDAGGLRKEWFLLLVREVFDPLNGMCEYGMELTGQQVY